MVQTIQDMLRRRLQEAGVWEKGKNAHSLRRVYEAEFRRNGGDIMAMDRIMGHFDKKNMRDLYYHPSIEELVEQANRSAPRRFLEAPQGELALVG